MDVLQAGTNVDSYGGVWKGLLTGGAKRGILELCDWEQCSSNQGR